MNRSEQINELALALSKAQSEIKGAVADSKNPFFKSKYANLESIYDAIREPLAKNQLSIVQATNPKETGVEVESVLMHSSGQWISSSLYMPADKTDPQTFGKLLTYCRRYSLAALIGVPQVDDDANSATGLKVGEVTAVGETAAKPETQDQLSLADCDHKWFRSKYKDKDGREYQYCSKCKIKNYDHAS